MGRGGDLPSDHRAPLTIGFTSTSRVAKRLISANVNAIHISTFYELEFILKHRKFTANDRVFGGSCGAMLGVGAALACKGAFNLAAADPTLTLVSCTAVGLTIGFGASAIFTRLHEQNSATPPKEKPTNFEGDIPSIEP